MSADTVEEPTVVADDHGTTGKRLKTFLKGTQSVDIDVVGRLVEKQHVAFLLEGERQLQTIALTTREHGTQFALVGAREIKP